MARVKYPYHVKHDGVDYKPGEAIEVTDAAAHLLRGAVIAEPETPSKPARKRKAAKTED